MFNCSKNYLAIFFVLFLTCQKDQSLASVQFLIGTWQVEGKPSFEVWEQLTDNKITGNSYKIVAGQKQVLETLVLEKENGVITYKATVPSQNAGQTISFQLNTSEAPVLSFENLEHDFPKKIQYKKVEESKIWVNVLGAEQQGFSYFLIKKE